MTRPPSAAAALYPHLKTGTPPVFTHTREFNLGVTADIASAMFGHLRPPAPKPPNPYRESLLRSLRAINDRHRER